MITRVRLEILKEIRNFIHTNSYSPTIREICEMIGIKSTSSIHRHLNVLEEDGYIKRKEASPRALRITEKGAGIIQ